MSALEQFPGRLPVPAAHLARVRENQGLAFHLQLSALIGTTAWPQIRHRELKTILELVPGGSLVRLGGLRVGFFLFGAVVSSLCPGRGRKPSCTMWQPELAGNSAKGCKLWL